MSDAIELPAPPGLPENWRCVHKTYKSGAKAGSTYTRYENDRYKNISSVKEAVKKAAEDSGADVEEALRQYDELIKKLNQPPEVLESFLPEESGLPADALALLPADAPAGHEAYRKCRYLSDARGSGIVSFSYNRGDSEKITFQATVVAACGSIYAACRIARACYLKIEAGLSKDEAMVVRNEWYAQFSPCKDSVPVAAFLTKPEQVGTKRKKDEDAKQDGDDTPALKVVAKQFVKADENNGPPADIVDAKAAVKEDGSKTEPGVEKTSNAQVANSTAKRLAVSGDKEKLQEPPEKGRRSEGDNTEGNSGVASDGQSGPQSSTSEPTAIADDSSIAPAVDPESTADFLPEANGLGEEILASLPADAPPGHPAYSKCQRGVDSNGATVVKFVQRIAGGNTQFQVGIKKSGSLYAAYRICRSCFVQAIDANASKDALREYRADCYKKLEAAMKGNKDAKPPEPSLSAQPAPIVPTKVDQKVRDPEHDGNVAAPADVQKLVSTLKRKAESEKPVAERAAKKLKAERSDESVPGAENSEPFAGKPKVCPTAPPEVKTPPDLKDCPTAPPEVKERRQPVPFSRVCAKMSVRSGLRCACHYLTHCPGAALSRPVTAAAELEADFVAFHGGKISAMTSAPSTPPCRRPAQVGDSKGSSKGASKGSTPSDAPVVPAKPFLRGDAVEVWYMERWHAATIVGDTINGRSGLKTLVSISGAEYEMEVGSVRHSQARHTAEDKDRSQGFRVGDELEVNYRGKWHLGKVTSDESNGQVGVDVMGWKYDAKCRDVRNKWSKKW